MKINCQERYDEVLEYAKSINDETFQECINRLKTWEENAKEQGRDMEIHLFRDHEPGLQRELHLVENPWLRA